MKRLQELSGWKKGQYQYDKQPSQADKKHSQQTRRKQHCLSALGQGSRK